MVAVTSHYDQLVSIQVCEVSIASWRSAMLHETKSRL